MIKINSVTIATPSTFLVNIFDLSDSFRGGKGTFKQEIIATKRTLEFSYALISWADISTLLTALKTPPFSVEYPDPETGTMRTGNFYIGDRKAPALDYQNGTVRWKDLKFNLIEI